MFHIRLILRHPYQILSLPSQGKRPKIDIGVVWTCVYERKLWSKGSYIILSDSILIVCNHKIYKFILNKLEYYIFIKLLIFLKELDDLRFKLTSQILESGLLSSDDKLFLEHFSPSVTKILSIKEMQNDSSINNSISSPLYKNSGTSSKITASLQSACL